MQYKSQISDRLVYKFQYLIITVREFKNSN
jgi:hypothetical protein